MEKDEKMLRTYKTSQYLLTVMFALLAVYLAFFNRGYDYSHSVRILIFFVVVMVITNLVLGKFRVLNKPLPLLRGKWGIVLSYTIAVLLILFLFRDSEVGLSWNSGWTKYTLIIVGAWSLLYAVLFNALLTFRNRKEA